MANLAASLTIIVALGLSTGEALVRLGFGLLLNLVVYLTNDYYDIEADLQSSHRIRAKALFLREHRWLALLTQGALVGLLALVGLIWSRGLVVTLLAGAGICWAYSARLKRIPYVDVATISVCGVAGAMVAFPLDRALGWTLAGLLGLYAGSFQAIQMIRDQRDDAAFGTRTTAVHLGVRKTAWLQRLLILSATAYAVALLHKWLGWGLVLAALLPLEQGRAERHWNHIRLIFGSVWLAIIVWIVLSGRSAGLCLVQNASQLLPALSPLR